MDSALIFSFCKRDISFLSAAVVIFYYILWGYLDHAEEVLWGPGEDDELHICGETLGLGSEREGEDNDKIREGDLGESFD